MSFDYVRPYVPGAVTSKGFIVVCVPGMRPVEVAETLALKITDFIVKKEYDRARQLLTWFGESTDVAE